MSEVLLICIGLLIGGNINLADSFYNHLVKDKHNIVFRKLSKILSTSFESIKLKSIKENDFQLEGN